MGCIPKCFEKVKATGEWRQKASCMCPNPPPKNRNECPRQTNPQGCINLDSKGFPLDSDLDGNGACQAKKRDECKKYNCAYSDQNGDCNGRFNTARFGKVKNTPKFQDLRKHCCHGPKGRSLYKNPPKGKRKQEFFTKVPISMWRPGQYSPKDQYQAA